MDAIYAFHRGDTPLLVSVPHAGTVVPPGINSRLRTGARQLPDTDWFVDRLYQRVTESGAGLLTANFSRYVIDLNRPPDDAALYDRAGTQLLPEYSFDGTELYRSGERPDEEEERLRKKQFWQPYHDKIQMELQQIRQRHGFAILLDAHSIRSRVPLLFDGRLPDLNLGSYRGASADPGLVTVAATALRSNPEYSFVLDGRFQGGYITRHYGEPGEGIHALQLEMVQAVYMREFPPEFDEKRAAKIQPVLLKLLDSLLMWSPEHD
jgi:N-formylglutamate amidohydrolase